MSAWKLTDSSAYRLPIDARETKLCAIELFRQCCWPSWTVHTDTLGPVEAPFRVRFKFAAAGRCFDWTSNREVAVTPQWYTGVGYCWTTALENLHHVMEEAGLFKKWSWTPARLPDRVFP